jgi:hypothetical protein
MYTAPSVERKNFRREADLGTQSVVENVSGVSQRVDLSLSTAGCIYRAAEIAHGLEN